MKLIREPRTTLERRPWWVRRATAVVGTVILVTLCFAMSANAAKKPRHVPPGELINPLLGPRYSQWLVGPVSWLATKTERDEYLFLSTDDEAEKFIEAWWQDHSEIRQQFDRRVGEADDQFEESTTPGYRTDRGIVWVLYGAPEEVEMIDHRDVLEPPIQRWSYSKSAPPGLDGNKPSRAYDFADQGSGTVFYVEDPAAMRRRRFEQRQRPPER